jgi:hypothetical protein
MKKIFLVLAMGTFLFSCGEDEKDKDDDEMSACDCVTEAEELAKEIAAAAGDADKVKELAEKSTDLAESCKDFKEEDYKDCDDDLAEKKSHYDIFNPYPEVTACSCKEDAEKLMAAFNAEGADMEVLSKEADALAEKCKDMKPEDAIDCK